MAGFPEETRGERTLVLFPMTLRHVLAVQAARCSLPRLIGTYIQGEPRSFLYSAKSPSRCAAEPGLPSALRCDFPSACGASSEPPFGALSMFWMFPHRAEVRYSSLARISKGLGFRVAFRATGHGDHGGDHGEITVGITGKLTKIRSLYCLNFKRLFQFHPWPPSGKPERHATRLVFLVVGFVAAAWACLVPFAKANAEVDEGNPPGLVLLCLGAGSILSMPTAGALSTRYGCRVVLTASSLVACAALPLLATVASAPILAVVLFRFRCCFGLGRLCNRMFKQ